MTTYNITSDLNLTEQQFYIGIRELNPLYSYKFYVDENGILSTNTIIFLGKLNDPFATLPSSEDILNAYNKVIKNEKHKLKKISKFSANISNLFSDNGIPLNISTSSAINNDISKVNTEILTVLQSILVCMNDFNNRLSNLEVAFNQNHIQ